MPRILIIDDEPIIRNGLASTIQNLNLFESVDTAKNGIEALALCKKVKYNALLLDIMMPQMNGLEFLEQLKEYELEFEKSDELPVQTIKVVLSGFDEFDYAQKAITLGVVEFLLKPLEPNDVVQLAKKLYEKSCLIIKNNKRQIQLRDQVRQSLPLLYEKFFNDLVEEDLDEEAILGKSSFLGIPLHAESYLVAVAAMVSSETKSGIMGNLSMQSLKSAIQDHPLSGFKQLFFETGLARCGIVFCFEKSCCGELSVEDYLSDLVCQIREKDGYLIHCGIGSSVEELSQIKRSYRKACAALMYTTLLSDSAVQKISDEEQGADPGIIMEDMSELSGHLKLGNAKKAEDFVQRVFLQFEKHPTERTAVDIKIILTGLLYTCLASMSQKNVRFDNERFLYYHKLIQDVNSLYSISEYKEITLKLIHNTLSKISSESNSKKLHLIEKAKEIVEEHGHENLTTQTVAERLGLSRNYFGQLFKKEVGYNFLEYLSRARITKAKRMLQTTTLKIYEVSSLVGIEDSFYFSSLFKKYVGCSPSEFREN